MKLTKQQEEMLSFVIKNSFMRIEHIHMFYSTKSAGKDAMDRLICLGFLEEDKEIFGRFKWTGKEYK